MRKILIASQKGGVGKTTTSINLAALAGGRGTRVLIVDADPLGSVADTLNLPAEPSNAAESPFLGRGRYWNDTLSGVDVVSPYTSPQPSDDELAEFLPTLDRLGDRYDLVIVDASPFLGQRPQMLLAATDEMVLVLRAEPMAYRTLPVFLQMVKEVQNRARSAALRGILLTLPSGEAEGSSLETEFRRAFGERLFNATIPHDPEVGQALLAALPVVQYRPTATAAQRYESLAAQLQLLPESPPIPTPSVTPSAMPYSNGQMIAAPARPAVLAPTPAPVPEPVAVAEATAPKTAPEWEWEDPPVATKPREDVAETRPEPVVAPEPAPAPAPTELVATANAPAPVPHPNWLMAILFAVGAGLLIAVMSVSWLLR